MAKIAVSPANSASSSAHREPSPSFPRRSLLPIWAKVEKRPKAFDIDMIRCIYCGLCEEVCPEQAIFLKKEYSITGYTRQEMVHDKDKLYEMGGGRGTGL